MRHLLRISAVLGLLFIAVAAKAQVSIGGSISFGTPPPAPRAFRVPPRPGTDFVWVDGYWYPQGRSWRWEDGYWTRPPQPGAFWVQPYWQNGRFFQGYWGTPRGGAIRHNHRWDRDPRRDFNRR